MALTFPELQQQYAKDSDIPNDLLYDALCIQRDDLINQAKLGLDVITKSQLGTEVRRRCKTDLFWLIRFFTWETNPASAGEKPLFENLVTEEEYRVLVDFFVKKDPSKSILEQDSIKDRVLLWPRGGCKTTCDIVDAVQWVLCFPDIRVLFLTGEEGLAVGCINEVKGHFLLKPETPTLMNLFFPEFCVEEKDLGNQFEFTCPVWKAKNLKRREPTIMSSSVGSTKSGWHYEIIKADDAVCDKNSESSDQCKKTSSKLSLAKNLLRAGGYYIDFIGTRYHEDDHYGILIENNTVGDLIVKKGPCWEWTESAGGGIRMFVARAITIKPEVVERLTKENKPLTYPEAGEDGCDLLIPKMMPYAWLMQKYRENEAIFEAQQNQNPRPQSKILFDRALLLRCTVPFPEMPMHGPVSQTWDFAYSPKKKRDYCTGASVIWDDKGGMFPHDLIRGKFKPTELAQAVVELAMKWRPFIVGIEDAGGSRFLEPTIQAEAKKTGNAYIIALLNKIDWYKPDSQIGAKRIRMEALHPWMLDGKLKIANYLPYLSALYEEFERCTLGGRHHDDIPDVLSMQPKYAPQMRQLIQSQEIESFSRIDAAFNLLFVPGTDQFGRVGMGYEEPAPDAEDTEPELETEPCIPGLPNVLGVGIWG